MRVLLYACTVALNRKRVRINLSLSLSLWDSASANTLKPLVIVFKAILLKTTTPAISDYNILTILPLKEREFLYTTLCPETSHPL